MASDDTLVVSSVVQTLLDIGGPPPEPLVGALVTYITSAGVGCDPMVVRLMAGVHTKEAITPIVGLLSIEGAPQRLITESFITLREQTGREDFGADAEAWESWWEEARWLPPREWEAMLAVAHAERARRLQRESDQQARRILDLHRRMYGLTPQGERSALLASMMRDTEPGVRGLAFELAERALLNTQRLDEQVRLAAIDRLSDSRPSIRASAASLLFRLGAGADATEAVRRAIRREADPVAAAAMLEFLRRRPNETDLMICLDWLGDAEPAATASARTLASSAASGGMLRPMIRNLAISSLRHMDPSAYTPGKLELWGILGESDDRDRLYELFGPEVAPALRTAAASAAVRWPDSVGPLTIASERDPVFFPMLADAITMHEPTEAGYRKLAGVNGIDSDLRAQRLLRLRRAIAPAEMLATIGPDESEGTVIESVLFDPDHRDLLRRDPRLVLTRALVLARYEAGDDQGVIELVGQIDRGQAPPLGDAILRSERRGLIALGRFDEASTAGADEQDWAAAAARSQRLDSVMAPAILAEIDERFPDEGASAPDAVTEADGQPDDEPGGAENDGAGDGMIQEILTLEPGESDDGAPDRRD